MLGKISLLDNLEMRDENSVYYKCTGEFMGWACYKIYTYKFHSYTDSAR